MKRKFDAQAAIDELFRNTPTFTHKDRLALRKANRAIADGTFDDLKKNRRARLGAAPKS